MKSRMECELETVKGWIHQAAKFTTTFRNVGVNIISAEMQCAWVLLNLTTFDFLNDDFHPAFNPPHNRKRINPYKPGWQMYDFCLDDTHYNTALKKIIKELLGTQLKVHEPVETK